MLYKTKVLSRVTERFYLNISKRFWVTIVTHMACDNYSFFSSYKPLFSFREPNNKKLVKTILDGTLPIEIRDKYRIGKNKVFIISYDWHFKKSNIENVYLSWIINIIADTEHCLAELMNVNCNVNKYINLQLNNYLVAFLEPRFFHRMNIFMNLW